mmetsp:Transcript_3305/g.10309  ORF Transcript_3305/g.10309 Transcript_3305/m.10309 type:complete len:303 (-) Transcript_3305:236-1144(-)
MSKLICTPCCSAASSSGRRRALSSATHFSVATGCSVSSSAEILTLTLARGTAPRWSASSVGLGSQVAASAGSCSMSAWYCEWYASASSRRTTASPSRSEEKPTPARHSSASAGAASAASRPAMKRAPIASTGATTAALTAAWPPSAPATPLVPTSTARCSAECAPDAPRRASSTRYSRACRATDASERSRGSTSIRRKSCVLSSGSPVACLVSASVTAQPPLCARAASSTRPAWRATLSSAGKGGSCDEGSRKGSAWALESEARETEPNARPARPAAAAAASRAALAPRRRAIDDIDPEGQN